ncbi:hypothetical protein [Nitrosomonas sp. Nm166]|uniref:hypothetical protein n=1 Tax=Nitrosomonas sp. Nm166 TaxID=1881054 RepID=UPI000B2BFFE4|nr:hypothetical protein [Nitrosomonas sp. Nm166]
MKEKGFYILPSDLFASVRKKARHDPNLNETLACVFKDIEGSAIGTDSEDDIKGLFDDLVRYASTHDQGLACATLELQ